MLRKDLIEGAEMIRSALESTGVIQALNNARRSAETKTSDKSAYVNVYKDYSLAAVKFSNAAKQMENILKIEFLRESNFWLTLMGVETEVKQKITMEKLQAVGFTAVYLTRITELLSRESDIVGKCKVPTDKPGFDKITVNVIEDKYVSTPERLILMLQSITELYEAVSTVHSLKASDLCVASCDSGSDKSFDFIGVAKGIVAVKEIILGLWDRVAFHQEARTKQQIEVIALALPVMETIARMETDGSMPRETAEIVRRQITGGLIKFREAGITIPEIDQKVLFNPRQILAPERKLLVGPKFQQGIEQEEEYCIKSSAETEDDSSDDAELKELIEKVTKQHLRNKKKVSKEPELESE